MPRPALIELTDEQRVEILDAYTKTDEPVGAICQRYGIKDTYIFNILAKVGIDWRRRDPISFETWQAQQQRQHIDEQQTQRDDALMGVVPEPVTKALENMIDTQHVLKPKPEPVAPTPAIERRVRISADTEMWAITVQGVILIEAADLEDAIRQVRRAQPGLRIMKAELSQ